MKYYSTNKKSEKVSFMQALIMGLAPDRGLFMPEQIPKLTIEQLDSFEDMEYSEIAFNIINKFLKNDIPKDELKKIVYDAYDFSIPIEKVKNNVHIMRLDQGPTASFKDFAARFMARIMNYFLKKENRKLKILVATSGDTGSAVADAFFRQENIKVVILFPKNEVSERQRKQMTTYGENISVFAVDAKFDDCQKIVKRAFSDPELSSLNLSSANSINIGRLLPQIVYYFYAYSRIKSDEIIFSVPSGNFGDLTGGMIAKQMGLPIKKFIVAVNENNEFPLFLESGDYKPISPSIKCLSNAMNVGHPSNFSRLIDIYEGQIDENGLIIKMPDMKRLREDIFSISVSDAETIETIKSVFERYKTIIEPHGAVAWKGVEEYLKKYPDESSPIISFETAHPAKFPEELNKLGIFPEAPASLADIDAREERNCIEMDNDYSVFKQFLKNSGL